MSTRISLREIRHRFRETIKRHRALVWLGPCVLTFRGPGALWALVWALQRACTALKYPHDRQRPTLVVPGEQADVYLQVQTASQIAYDPTRRRIQIRDGQHRRFICPDADLADWLAFQLEYLAVGLEDDIENGPHAEPFSETY